jgi:uncharacterized protein
MAVRRSSQAGPVGEQPGSAGNTEPTAPIGREDILDLTSALDDIVDWIEEVADYLGLYKIEAPMEQAERMAGVLHAATIQLAVAIPRIRGFEPTEEQTVEVHRLENVGDQMVREAIASLFEYGTDPMVVIRGRTSSSGWRTRSTRPSGRRTSSRGS